LFNLHRFFEFRELEDQPRSIIDHLEDLRKMLIKMATVLGLAMMLSFIFRHQITAMIQHPLVAVDPKNAEGLQSLGVADSLMISFSLAFYAGLIFSLPFLLYFLAEFLMPALLPKERRAVIPTALMGFLLFLIGGAFGYFAVLPRALDFFYKDAKSLGWIPIWTVREYYAFTTQFIISFGLAFELPAAVLLLVRLGFLDTKTLIKIRPHAVVAIFVLAALIVPTPDLLTFLLMGVPMYGLYELCILIARFVEKKERLRDGIMDVDVEEERR